MCGIAGLIGRIDPANEAALHRMTAALAHRGPDGVGVWSSTPDSSRHGCMLGHRRLAILDLSHAADQPMTDDAHGAPRTMVFNGEIYNFQDLRQELVGAGETFESSGDTAVLLRLLVRRGPDAVKRLRGMFAFGLWDAGERRLLLARDPLGIKPLYVCRNPDSRGSWSLAFASEVRAILASGLLQHPRLDRSALRSVVWNGFVNGPSTAVDGIESLRPGELRLVGEDGAPIRTRRYWQLPRPGEAPPTSRAELGAVLEHSVRLHLISDVPLGIFLSSGIDSSAVANLAQRTSTAPVHTFTLGFEEAAFNEGDAARAIARAIGSEHHEVLLTEGQFAGALQAAIDTLDQPTFDGLNSFYISKAVREAGLTVALLGTGGDELFGGYSSFSTLPAMMRWAQRSRVVPAAAKTLAARIASRALIGAPAGSAPPQTRWAKLPDMVQADGDLLGLYQLAYALFLPEFQGELLLRADAADGVTSGLPSALAAELESEIAGHPPLTAISILEQRLFLGERLLRDTDAASMAVSLETRLPLVDSVIAETVAGLSLKDRFDPIGRKAALRAAGLDGLDPALFERPKQGFVLPFDQWIRRSLGSAMDDTMRDASLAHDVGLNGAAVSRLWTAFQAGAPGLYWSRVWAIYILIRWCHRHGVLL